MHLERQGLAMQLVSDSRRTILVTGASGIVGYGILKSLKESNCFLIGSTVYEASPANCFSDLVIKPPMTEEEGYINWLVSSIRDNSIDMIIPSIEADMNKWNKNRKLLEETGTVVVLNNERLIDLCLDKWNFYLELNKYNPDLCIKTSIIPEYEQFTKPFILKPRCGYGSRGFKVINSKQEFNQYKEDIGLTYIMQEYVGTDDEEYTVSAFFDKESNLRAYLPMKRKLSKNGYTDIAETVYVNEMESILLQLANTFKPVGPTNFQFRKHINKWKLLEINPRISSSTSIRAAFGYNESKMCLDYFLEKKEIEQPIIKNGTAIRYVEDYVTYDCNNI